MQAGLSEYEAKVYHALLKKHVLTATEVSRLSEVPRGKIYEVLDRLVNNGFCTEITGVQKKYKAVDPRLAFRSLSDELLLRQQMIEQTAGVLGKLYDLESPKFDPLDYIEVIRDPKRIGDKVQMLERQAQHSVLFFAKPPYAMNFYDMSNWDAQIESTARGVKYKCIFEKEPDNADQFMEMVIFFESIGEEVRVVPHLPIKMVIFDERSIMFTLKNSSDAQHPLTALFIEHEDLALTLKEIFDMYWNRAPSRKATS